MVCGNLHVFSNCFVIFTYDSARGKLHETAPRVMAVLRPLKVIISGLDEVVTNKVLDVPDFPFAPERGTHHVIIESEIYVDLADFRMEDSEDYFGLAPGKLVGLKAACWIHCDSVEVDESGNPTVLRATAVKESVDAAVKPRSTIQWVPASTSTTAEVGLTCTPYIRLLYLYFLISGSCLWKLVHRRYAL